MINKYNFFLILLITLITAGVVVLFKRSIQADSFFEYQGAQGILNPSSNTLNTFQQ